MFMVDTSAQLSARVNWPNDGHWPFSGHFLQVGISEQGTKWWNMLCYFKPGLTPDSCGTPSHVILLFVCKQNGMADLGVDGTGI